LTKLISANDRGLHVLKGEFQRANIMRTKLSGVLKGKPLIIQVVRTIEASPEKAGVGGSTPSLATIILKNLVAKNENFLTHDPHPGQ
jgi:hypothetical protein